MIQENGEMTRCILSVVLVVIMLIPLPALTGQASENRTPSAALTKRQMTASPLESLDGYFIENRGQVAEGVRYYSRGNPSVAFRNDGVMFVFREVGKKEGDGLDGSEYQFISTAEKEVTVGSLAYLLRFVNANKVTPLGRERLSFNSNFFIGDNASEWRTNVPNFKEVVYQDLYDGIDLIYRHEGNGVKYEFVVNPGANPQSIELGYDGIETLGMDGGGLAAHTSLTVIRDSSPISYQGDEEVSCAFALRGRLSFGFHCEAWDPSRNLLIDPLIYSTFLGGAGYDSGPSLQVDSAGNAYLTGGTYSVDFPTSPGAFNVTLNGSEDAFVAKLNGTGGSLAYSTFLGGGDSDAGLSLALDTAGNVCLTGSTQSADFPTTLGAYNRTLSGRQDVFVTKLNATGSALIYSTLVGGDDNDGGMSIKVDADGNPFVTGYTYSSSFPVTVGAYDTTFNGGTPPWLIRDGFVMKMDATGSSLIYSTFLGGSGPDHGSSIAVDTAGNAYVTGFIDSPDFPTTPNALQSSYGLAWDTFVTKINATGGSLDYSTYLGGAEVDFGASIAIDSSGNAYVTGHTDSTDFPITPGAYDVSLNRLVDGFVAKLNSSGSGLVYSTFLGGSGDDTGRSIALSPNGEAYVAGSTYSSDFPVLLGAYDLNLTGESDYFVTKFDASGNTLAYSTYLGGNDGDVILKWNDDISIALGIGDMVYLAGCTASATFPTTPGAFDRTFNGRDDVFVTKLAPVLNSQPVVSNPGVQGFTVPPGTLHVTDFLPTLNWTYSDAENDEQTIYDIRVGTTSGGTDMLSPSQTFGKETLIAYSGSSLSRGVDYWFSVRTNDGNLWSTWAEVKFRLNSLPSSPANAISPVEASTQELSTAQAVTWGASTDVDGDLVSYEWQVATNTVFTTVVAAGTTTAATSSAFATVDGSTYYWRVRARDDYEPTNWSAYGNEPLGYWMFRVSSNTPPTVIMISPVGGEQWIKGSTHTVTWSMHDLEDEDANLTVYLNYSTGGVTASIAAGLKGLESYQWILPDITAMDVVINVTVIDSEGLRGWAQSGPFVINVSALPPPIDVNYKPIVALVFAVILFVAGVWSSKRRPWKGGRARMAVAKAFVITSMPFLLAEAATGTASYQTGQLAIPPTLGFGTVVDLGVLVAGLIVALARVLKVREMEAEATNEAANR